MRSQNNSITKHFALFVQKMWLEPKTSSYDQQHLKTAIGQENDLFKGCRQQDSHDYLLCLIGKIDDDLNRVQAQKVNGQYEMPYIEYPLDKQIARLEPKSKITDLFQEINLLSNQSIIQDLFSSDFKSTIICNGCKSVKIMLEKMSLIPISLNSLSKDIKLKNQLKLYGQMEQISEMDACFYCKTCNALRGIQKSQEILQLGPIIVFSLQRFLNNRKTSDYVEYPASIKMGNYICEDRYKKDTEYEIYGVVNHQGSLNGGHYTANCKTDQGWYNFNDSRVSKINESQIFNNSAYLLFYKRKHFNPEAEHEF